MFITFFKKTCLIISICLVSFMLISCSSDFNKSDNDDSNSTNTYTGESTDNIAVSKTDDKIGFESEQAQKLVQSYGVTDVQYQQLDEGVAAIVNDDVIFEQDITSQIEAFRTRDKLDTEESWRSYLAEMNQDPEFFRAYQIMGAVQGKIQASEINKANIEVGDEELETNEIQNLHNSSFSVDELRIIIKYQKFARSLFDDIEYTDAVVNKANKLNESAYPYIVMDDIPDDIKRQCEKEVLNEKLSEFYKEKLESAHIITSPMPENVSYNVDMNE